MITTDPTSKAPRTDAPRTNRSSVERERKRKLLYEPRIEPLTTFVDALRAERHDRTIPYFDPTGAGVDARILALLEAPGSRAALGKGSGFISPDNNDPTAENMWKILSAEEVDRATEIVFWNVVPWYIGSGTRVRAAVPQDFVEARDALHELLSLLLELRVVVLLGRKAASAWAGAGIDGDYTVIEAPHPSPKVLNTRRGARNEIIEALRDARRAAGIA